MSSDEFDLEPDIVELDGAAIRSKGHPGTSSSFICPDCGGTLFQQEGNLLEYRCRVGHAWSETSLVAGQALVQEEALWAAIRSLEERAELMLQLASNARKKNYLLSAERFEAQAQEAEQRGDLIRQALFQGQLPVTENPTATKQVSKDGQTASAAFPVVVLAAEAGGLVALSHLLAALPMNFPAAIIVVQHLDTQTSPNLLTDVVSSARTLPLKLAQAGESLQPVVDFVLPLNEIASTLINLVVGQI